MRQSCGGSRCGSPGTPRSRRTSCRSRCCGPGATPGSVGRSDAQARAWLFTVVRNLVVDRWRSAANRHEVSGLDWVNPLVADRTGEVLDRWLLADALGSLSPDHRRVVAAAYYEGRTVAEIAAELRIPEGTVKSRLHYGLRSLRLALQEKGVTRA